MSKLYKVPDEGMISGVCAGIAHYLALPTLVVRIVAILALFAGAFIPTIIIYFLLAFFLESTESPTAKNNSKVAQQMAQATTKTITTLESEIAQSELRLRKLEQYLTSETFNVENQFRQL